MLQEAQRQQQIQAYIDGRMSEDEAQAFEQAYFGDDELAAELDRAIEIRAATADSGAPRRLLPVYYGMAAAVLLALVVLAFYQSLPRPEIGDGTVMRGEASELRVTVASDGATLRATWTAVAGARLYQLDFYRADGSTVTQQLVSEPAARTDLEQISGAAYLRVTALGELGNVLVDSGLLALDIPE